MYSKLLSLCLGLALAACGSPTIASQLKGVPHETLSQRNSVTHVRLDATATLGGIAFPEGTIVNFYESKFVGASLVSPLTVSGVAYPTGTHLGFSDGLVSFAEPTGDVTIGANTFGDGDVLVFMRQGSTVMLAATLGVDREVGGTAYAAGDQLIYGPTGQLVTKTSKSERAAIALQEARERRTADTERRAKDKARSQCLSASKCESLSTAKEKGECRRRCDQ